MDKLKLMKTANEIRKGIVSSVHSAKAGHPGGSLSAADIFTYLYFEELRIDPKEPKKADRDRFVLSKGHTAPGLYSALAERGYFPKEDLLTLRHVGSYLQGHPDMKKIPGVDMSSGSLGPFSKPGCIFSIPFGSWRLKTPKSTLKPKYLVFSLSMNSAYSCTIGSVSLVGACNSGCITTLYFSA